MPGFGPAPAHWLAGGRELKSHRMALTSNISGVSDGLKYGFQYEPVTGCHLAARNNRNAPRGVAPAENPDFFPGYTVALIIGIKTREKYLCRKDWKP